MSQDYCPHCGRRGNLRCTRCHTVVCRQSHGMIVSESNFLPWPFNAPIGGVPPASSKVRDIVNGALREACGFSAPFTFGMCGYCISEVQEKIKEAVTAKIDNLRQSREICDQICMRDQRCCADRAYQCSVCGIAVCSSHAAQCSRCRSVFCCRFKREGISGAGCYRDHHHFFSFSFT